jgi:hypothetical protein
MASGQPRHISPSSSSSSHFSTSPSLRRSLPQAPTLLFPPAARTLSSSSHDSSGSGHDSVSDDDRQYLVAKSHPLKWRRTQSSRIHGTPHAFEASSLPSSVGHGTGHSQDQNSEGIFSLRGWKTIAVGSCTYSPMTGTMLCRL